MDQRAVQPVVLEGSLAVHGRPDSGRICFDSLCRVLVDGSCDIVGVFDKHGAVVRMSRTGVLLTGVAAERMIGRRLVDYLPEEMWDDLEATLMGEEARGEHLLKAPAGSPLWLSASWQPLRDAGGAVSGGVLVARDVTAEKSGARFRNYIETSPVAAAQSTPEGKLLYASRACAEMFGYASAEDFVAAVNCSSISDIAWCEPLQRRAVVDAAVAAEGSWVSSQFKGKRRDGSIFAVRLHLCSRRDALSQEPYLFSFLQDMSEVSMVEERLERTDEMLREAERLAGFGGWEWDVSAGTIEASAGGQAILGVPCNAITKREFESVVYAEDRRVLAAALRRIRPDGETSKVELRIVRPDTGETRHVAIYGKAVEHEHDAPTRMRGAILDITERVQVLDALGDKERRLRATLTGAIDALGATVEMRDPYTAGHERRVAKLACTIAKSLGWGEEEVEKLWTASLLHDIGKLAIPAELLTKPSRLTRTEFDLIKTHSAAGRDILASIDFDAPIAEIVAQHHERLDGSGYPRGLSDGEILPAARILAVADVVEAMVSHRPYRPALPVSEAIAEIEQGSGVRYDADVAAACIALFTNGLFDFSGS